MLKPSQSMQYMHQAPNSKTRIVAKLEKFVIDLILKGRYNAAMLWQYQVSSIRIELHISHCGLAGDACN